MKKRAILPLILALAIISAAGALASEGASEATTHNAAMTFFTIALLLIAAKASSLVERFGQPSVLGELVIGVVLGNLTLVGFHMLEPIKSDPIIAFLAELGVVILLFQIGLESNIQKMRAVGLRALLVATVGVVAPFALGTWLVGPWLLPGLPFNAYLFLGAALTATSVGITARVFRDLGKLQTPEAQIVLGAAVIDDVMGLVILAVVSAIATAGTVSALTIGWITLKALLFLVGAIVLGSLLAPWLGRLLSAIHTGVGMKFTLAIGFCLVIAALAQLIGLAPIVGAFAAGLVLDPVHFRYFKDFHIVEDMKEAVTDADTATRNRVHAMLESHSHRHVEYLIEPLGHFLVPLFFVMTGMAVKLETLFDLPILLVALGITVAAFIGKIIAGLVAGNVRKSLVGWGMVPRGEVGLIFAAIGKAVGVVSDSMYSVIVIVVILTTLLTPPILTSLLKRKV
ncbi:MAG: cation:proton antiporter [Candidatus Peribacteraceae bacterium]|nr:cation:proton antiporter [Candidatus Peribacteraceae bacterium]